MIVVNSDMAEEINKSMKMHNSWLNVCEKRVLVLGEFDYLHPNVEKNPRM